jgi:S-adenosylmethionine:diacylglycerol 3-amino-3-carboxypropyl transferase
MQYNFEVRTALNDEELSSLISDVAEGLEGSSQVVMRTSIRVNTELPDEKVEALRQAVDDFITDKLGADTEVALVSQEH